MTYFASFLGGGVICKKIVTRIEIDLRYLINLIYNYLLKGQHSGSFWLLKASLILYSVEKFSINQKEKEKNKTTHNTHSHTFSPNSHTCKDIKHKQKSICIAFNK